MKIVELTAVMLTAFLSLATIGRAEDDELGKRLLIVAETNCGPRQGAIYSSGESSCNAAKIMAATFYGQRLQLRAVCAGSSKVLECSTAMRDLDNGIKRLIFRE